MADGDFESGWLSDLDPPEILAPATGSTGDFESGWLTDVDPPADLVEAVSTGLTGTATLTIGAPALAASGTATPPAITGTAALAIGAPVLAGAGTYTPLAITGTAALAIGAPALAAAGTADAPPGAGALTIGPPALAASGTAIPPAITGTASLAIGKPALAASGAFTSPLLFLFDGDLLPVLADGTTVQIATDQSGSGNDATQATSGLRPAYRTAANGIGGHPALDFSGGKRMATPSCFDASFNTSITIYAVFKRASGTGTQSVAATGSNTLKLTIAGALAAGNTGIQETNPAASPNVAFASARLGLSASSSPPLSETVVASLMYNGANYFVSANGQENQSRLGLSGIAATGNFGLTGALTLGANASALEGFEGQIAYLAIYRGTHNRVTRKAEELRLRQLYGVIPPRVIICIGDSIMAGSGASDTATTSLPGRLLATITRTGHVENIGRGGSTAAQWLATFSPDQVEPFYNSDRTESVVVVWVGGNDGVSSQAQAYLDVAAICTNIKTAGFRVVVITVTPRAGGAYNALNANIRANWPTFADGFVDLDPEPPFDQIPSLAADTGNLTYYNADGTHLADGGYNWVNNLTQPVVDGIGAATGSGGLTIDRPALAATGTATPPAITGSAGLTIGAPALAAAGTFTLPPGSGAGALIIGPPSLAATGTAIPPPVTGTGALTIGAPALAASGTVVSPPTGSASLSIGAPVLTGSGTATVLAISGSGGLAIGGPKLAGAEVTLPTRGLASAVTVRIIGPSAVTERT